MSDEKELIEKIRNSEKQGMSRAEITRRLQKKGFKLEYIDLLIKKSKTQKKIILRTSLIFILIIAVAITAAYFTVFNPGQEKLDIKNPLAGFKILFGKDQSKQNPQINTNLQEINFKDVEITPEFLSYILNEAGAYQLHSNPLTGEEAIINFEIQDNTNYHAEIDETILTLEKISTEPDITFKTNKEDIVRAILSEEPGDYFVESIQQGETIIEVVADETELTMKGYLGFYKALGV